MNPDVLALIPKHLETRNFYKVQQIVRPVLGAEGRVFESLRPDH